MKFAVPAVTDRIERERPDSVYNDQACAATGLIVGNRRQQQDMIRAIETTGLKPVIDRTLGIEALADAFRYQETGKHLGKICVEF